MLKVAACAEERRGNALMTWWNGDGAAYVWAHDDDAVLIERAQPASSLADMSRSGRDDDATRIACAVVNKLHAHRSPHRPGVVPLAEWFEPLRSLSAPADPVLRLCATVANTLLREPRTDEAVLHGDIHHENILYFGGRGWLAIDPKGLLGQRTAWRTDIRLRQSVLQSGRSHRRRSASLRPASGARGQLRQARPAQAAAMDTRLVGPFRPVDAGGRIARSNPLERRRTRGGRTRACGQALKVAYTAGHNASNRLTASARPSCSRCTFSIPFTAMPAPSACGYQAANAST